MKRVPRTYRRKYTRVDESFHTSFVTEKPTIIVGPSTDSVIRLTSAVFLAQGATPVLNLFRRYKITKVKYSIIPQFSVANTDANLQAGFAFSCVDPWGQTSAVPAFATALNNSKARKHDYMKPFDIVFKPTIMNAINTDVATTTYAQTPMPAPELNCDTSANVVHYGAEVMLNNPGLLGLQWQVIETQYVTFTQRNGT